MIERRPGDNIEQNTDYNGLSNKGYRISSGMKKRARNAGYLSRSSINIWFGLASMVLIVTFSSMRVHYELRLEDDDISNSNDGVTSLFELQLDDGSNEKIDKTQKYDDARGTKTDTVQQKLSFDNASKDKIIKSKHHDYGQEDIREIDVIHHKKQLTRNSNESPGPIGNEEEIWRTTSNGEINLLHQSRVVSEFCMRTLSRNIAQSSVLVITSDIPLQHFQGDGTVVHGDYQERLLEGGEESYDKHGRVIVSRAIEEDHNVIILPPSINLNSWWNNEDSEQRQHSKADLSWILLAYFIPGGTRVKVKGQDMYDDDSIDKILQASRVSDLLKESTITYIVYEVNSYQKANEVHVSGLIATQTLLNENYKIQLLASTHYNSNDHYQPNHHFKHKHDVHSFLESGASFAAQRNSNFGALLFATQGLDLAIPSRMSYLNVSAAKPCQFERIKRSGRCDSKLDARALGDNVFMKCPERHKSIQISFDKFRPEGVTVKKRKNGVYHEINPKKLERAGSLWLGHSDPHSAEAACVQLGQRVSCQTRIIPQPSLMTNTAVRYRERSDTQRLTEQSLGISKLDANPYNILTILIDPLSQDQLLRSLPNTASLLSKLNFITFGNYTIVGDNSGPNQSALYSGLPLVGRNGIKSSSSHGTDTNAPKWLWDLFGKAGYATLKGEDICISNSNMVQYLKPNTTHGSQLYEMFCFDFDRPNCLGKDLAAKHLVQYVTKFIDTYSKMKRPFAAFVSFVDSHEDSLTLISYIDTLLVKLIQKPPSNTVIVFLSDHGLHYGPSMSTKLGERERAEPLLYMKLPQSLPDHSHNTLRQNAEYWTTPFDVYETVFDIFFDNNHQLGNDRIGQSLIQPLPNIRTKCQLTPGIPDEYCKLLMYKTQQNDNLTKKEECTFMPNPPSIFSFYADIRKENKPSWPNCTKTKRTAPINANQRCLVGSSLNLKFEPCEYWKCKKIISEYDKKEKRFSVIYCDELQHVEMNVQIERLATTVSRHKERVKREKIITPDYDPSSMPNILFLEIDSLSMSAAERHFPKTLELLKSHGIVDHSASNTRHCPTGFCSAIFNKTSVVGQQSIPNQLAALSGCIDKSGIIPKSDLYLHHDWKRFKTWCPTVPHRAELKLSTDVMTRNKDYATYGKILSIESNGTFHVSERYKPAVKNKFVPRQNITALSDSPWLFDVVDRLGYVTLFGDEFCYEGSPFVVQGRSFPINVDYEVHKAFCLLSKLAALRQKPDGNLALWTIDEDSAQDPKPCIDGRSRQQISFEYIRGMWNAYPDIPKFAYLSALAAHDYSIDLSYQTLGAEAYDELLSDFLKEMLSRSDASKTIIILRSDHGMQGGPSPIDYSTQIEHMNPWNNIIVPADFPGLSKDVLFFNQDKLNTGFDLYHTLRKILIPRRKESAGKDSKPYTVIHEIPKWSYNLLDSPIPRERSCFDARIPTEFCPCVNERTDMMPYFYVGHAEKLSTSLTTDLSFTVDLEGILIPDLRPGIDLTLSKKVVKKKSMYMNIQELKANFKDIMRKGSKGLKETLLDSRQERGIKRTESETVLGGKQDKIKKSYKSEFATSLKIGLSHDSRCNGNETGTFGWNEINLIIDSFPNADVSGGISLYPRQQLFLANLVRQERSLKAMKDQGPFRICETGFGGGHSASFFLSLYDNIQVITFDKFDRPYQPAVVEQIKAKFGDDRLHIVEGDSCETVPSYLQEANFPGCDFLHASSLCKSDNIDLIKHSVCGTILTTTAMHSISDHSVYFGPNAQWRKLHQSGCITNIKCFTDQETTLSKKFVFSSKGMKKIAHKFCFAVNTGLCHDSKVTKIDDACRTINGDIFNFCPDVQVEPPL